MKNSLEFSFPARRMKSDGECSPERPADAATGPERSPDAGGRSARPAQGAGPDAGGAGVTAGAVGGLAQSGGARPVGTVDQRSAAGGRGSGRADVASVRARERPGEGAG